MGPVRHNRESRRLVVGDAERTRMHSERRQLLLHRRRIGAEEHRHELAVCPADADRRFRGESTNGADVGGESPESREGGFIRLLGRFGALGLVHGGQIDLDDATEDLVDPDRQHLGEAEQPGYRHRALAPLVGAERRAP